MSYGQTTATGLSKLLGDEISHDKITRGLSQNVFDSKYLWGIVKPFIEELKNSKEPRVINFDDSIEEKQYSEEFPKSIKSNTSFSKSPTHAIHTQCNYFMLSIIAYVKMEKMRLRNRKNHFEMKSRMYLAAVKAARMELNNISDQKFRKVA